MAAFTSPLAGVLASLLASASEDARRWLDLAHASSTGNALETDVLRAYAGAGRRLGAESVSPSAAEQQVLADAGVLGVAGWSRARVGRALILIDATPRIADAPRFVAQLFRTGDNDERIALLGTLAALEGPRRFVDVAQEACRTHVTSVFEAIACRNVYPALYFSDDAFNQMVLKALFIGVKLAGIDGLERRSNAELLRMAAAYASERRAAGRPVPDDALRILALERNAS